MLKVISPTQIKYNGKIYPCIIGENGLTSQKKEGDSSTPIGTFTANTVYYRPNKDLKIITKMKVIKINKNLGWCDEALCPLYNSPVILPHQGSYENMWRDDNAYDIVIPISYNQERTPYKGSAIFIHCMRQNCRSTKGCIALKKSDLLDILSICNEEITIDIQ